MSQRSSFKPQPQTAVPRSPSYPKRLEQALCVAAVVICAPPSVAAQVRALVSPNISLRTLGGVGKRHAQCISLPDLPCMGTARPWHDPTCTHTPFAGFLISCAAPAWA